MTADDAFADRLAELDEAMAAGGTLVSHADDTPADLRDRLARGAAVLRDLQHLRVGVRAGSVSEGLSKPLAHASGSTGTRVRIGRFTIIRELGRGGFGVVFLARDPALHRDVALKVPHAHALVDPALRDRFRREALAAAGLDHPNLVPVFEVDDAGPVCFIASAYCPGPSLAEWLSRRPAVTAREAARLVATLADAIAHAHARGVQHRDLKPANILMQIADASPSNEPQQSAMWHLPTAIPKITDFGLARLADDPDRHTRTGAGLGTPAYMAPEQAAGAKNSGPAVDQYALGVILYELLTGRPPFRGETDLETLRQVVECDPVAPRRLRPGLPRDLETICLKCLEKEPAKRYGSVADLADDLRRFAAGKPVLARRVGVLGRTSRWCRRKPVVAGLSAALAVAIVAGAIGMVREYHRAERERDAAIVERDRGRRLVEQAHAALARLRDLGDDPQSVAQVFNRAGPDGETETGHRRADDLLAQLAASGSAGEDRHYLLVAALDQARLGMGTAGWDSSVRSMSEIVGQQRATLAAKPNDRDLTLDLAMALEWLAAVYHDGERWAEAEKLCREALALRQWLLADRPGAITDQIALALGWCRLGGTIVAAGRYDDAVEPYTEADRIYDAVIAAAPNDPLGYHEYAKHLFDWWRLCDRRDRGAERIPIFKKLIAVRTELVRLQPNSGPRKSELAWAHLHLARQSWLSGDPETARTEIATVRRLFAADIPPDQAAVMRKLFNNVDELCRRMDAATAAGKP
jgi:serine/threonine protein kinase/tetratricopeptide (TPR) repeat protein